MNRSNGFRRFSRIPWCVRTVTLFRRRELPQPDIKGLSVQLDKLRQGETASITHIASEDLDRVRRLISMGFVPGHDIIIEEKVPVGGPLLVRIEGRRIALAKDMASLVWVRRA